MNKPVAWNGKPLQANTITFNNINSDWVMQITADRKIIVNENIEVSDAAKAVLDAVQNLLLVPHPVKEHNIGISHAIGFDDGFKAGMQRAVEMNVVKELTDEEIKKIFIEESGFDVDTCPIAIMDFAKAILRKAQEK